MSQPTRENVVTLGVLRFRGRDAVSFLHGQLSSDVQSLVDGAQQLAGYHTPQGRVIALLRLTRLGREDLLAQLPAELAAPVAQRLGRFVLRARLTIEPLDAAATAAALESAPTRPAQWNGTRSRAADIAAGLPQVYAVTSERFVAQMLNLDCIGALSFDKGCYTGQEVIARAHYRGRVKRRMQRFATRMPHQAPLHPGDPLSLADGRRVEVVDAVSLADGRVEFLAVGPLPGAAEPAEAVALIDCEALPLPYALPE